MIISVASGKGGTGKTTVAVNLALSFENVQLLDCDVEEPNAHIFLKPTIENTRAATVPIPQVDGSFCDYCGKCREVCAYNAIAVFQGVGDKKGSVLIFPHLCHGCGGCSLLCPQHAINEVEKEIGFIETGTSGNIHFVNGHLTIGEIMSPPLIRQVKQYAEPSRNVIIDAPPGTSCPVIAAVKGSDFCILVTEPTPFGLHDLMLAVEVLERMQIPFGIVINRADIGNTQVEEFCARKNIPIIMRIPYDENIAFLYSQGIPLVDERSEYKEKFEGMISMIEDMLK